MEEAALLAKRAVSIRKVATQLRFCGNQSLFPLIRPGTLTAIFWMARRYRAQHAHDACYQQHGK